MNSLFYVFLISSIIFNFVGAQYGYGYGMEAPGDTDLNNIEATSHLPQDNEDDDNCNCDDDDEDDDSTVATQLPPNNIKTTASPPSNNGGSGSVSGSIEASCELRDKWGSGANFILSFKNNGNSKACAVKFQLELASGQTIQSIWNVQKQSENIYTLPNYMSLNAGEENKNAGLVVNGPPTLPKITLLGQGACTPY